jgi:flagellin
MVAINTNMSANIAANAMLRNDRNMGTTMAQLATGIRINSAKDDAAGLAISSKMTKHILGMQQAARNTNDAISMIQVAEGALQQASSIYQRMRVLAVQAISDSNADSDRAALDTEFQQLADEVKRIGQNTQWNGSALLDGSRTNAMFQVGANANQTVKVDFGELSRENPPTWQLFQASGNFFAANTAISAPAYGTIIKSPGNTSGVLKAGDVINMTITSGKVGTVSFKIGSINTDGDLSDIVVSNATGFNVGTISAITSGSSLYAIGDTATEIGGANPTATVTDVTVVNATHSQVDAAAITTAALATAALGSLDTAITDVNSSRATLGASANRLEFAAENIRSISQNTAAARSRILDADYAAQTTEIARMQIVQQASIAMLAQANVSKSAVLALLK